MARECKSELHKLNLPKTQWWHNKLKYKNKKYTTKRTCMECHFLRHAHFFKLWSKKIVCLKLWGKQLTNEEQERSAVLRVLKVSIFWFLRYVLSSMDCYLDGSKKLTLENYARLHAIGIRSKSMERLNCSILLINLEEGKKAWQYNKETLLNMFYIFQLNLSFYLYWK